VQLILKALRQAWFHCILDKTGVKVSLLDDVGKWCLVRRLGLAFDV
jgi:hypothetical protein